MNLTLLVLVSRLQVTSSVVSQQQNTNQVSSQDESGAEAQMNQAQFATQSASIRCGGTESKIKGILTHRSSAPPTLISQDLLPGSRPLPPEENPSEGEERFSPASFMGVIQNIDAGNNRLIGT
jgi:hypothetical protein